MKRTNNYRKIAHAMNRLRANSTGGYLLADRSTGKVGSQIFTEGARPRLNDDQRLLPIVAHVYTVERVAEVFGDE